MNIEIPMCWKCSDAQMSPQNTSSRARILTGCKACEKVHDYQSAQRYCPLLNKGETSK